MKKILLIFGILVALFFGLQLYSKKQETQGPLSKYRIKPEGEKWRPETIEKILNVCTTQGGKKEDCVCSLNHAMANYKENEYLRVRERMLTLAEKGVDVTTDLDVKNLVESTKKKCKE